VGRRRYAPFPHLLIALVLLLAYHRTFTTPFLFDDTGILDTEALHELSSRTVSGTTRPLVQLSFALNWAAGGASVVGYHAFNFVVHLLAALVLYGVVARTLRTTGLALAIALVWAVHPLQTESVTYVVQRAESLMGLGYLLTLYCVIRSVDSPHAARWYVAAVTACGLGMLCKPVMVTAPLLVLLYDRVFLASEWKRVWRERGALYAGLLATWTTLVALLAGQQHESAATAGFTMQDVTLAEFARSQPGVILHYLRLVVWPHGLVLDYAWPPAAGVTGVILPTLFLAGSVAALLVTFRARPKLAFLVLAFLLILAPSSSVVPIRDLAFEHRMYLPLAPLVTLIVLSGWAIIQRAGLPAAHERRVTITVVAIVVAALGALTIARNHDYRSSVAMWTDVTTKRPPNVRAYSNLAQALMQEGRIDDATVAARTALQLDPAYADAHVHLGHALAARGAYREAEAHYAEAVRLKPSSAEAHNNWGAALADQKRYAEAEPHYLAALRLRPAYAAAKNNLGVALMQRGRLAEAAVLYREAIRLSPAYAEPYSNLGTLLARQGQRAESVQQYQRALALKPDSAEVHFNLALALADQNRRAEAGVHAAEAVRLRPDLEPLVRQAGLSPAR
jgi:tetratricopeptide (TPR) repeat protein